MTRRIRVIEILNGLGIEQFGGGAERFVVALSHALNPAQFEVTICGLWSRGTQLEQKRREQLEAKGIHTFFATKWEPQRLTSSFLTAVKNVRNWLTQNPVDILHSHSQFGDVLAPICKMTMGVPVALRTVHDGHSLEWRKRPLRRLLFTNLLYPFLFDVEIGVNPFIAERLSHRRLAALLRKRSLCIYNALDAKRFSQITVDRAQKRLSLGISPHAFVVGFVGRLVEGKGVEILLEAFAIVVQQAPQVMGIIIGDGEWSTLLHTKAQQLGIGKNVRFLGPRTDIEELYVCMDLFVLPSFWEGLPTVILESMASGIPVLASDIPGNRLLIKDQVNGWLTPPGHAQALADKILTSLNSPSALWEITLRARETVKKFDIENIAPQHEKLYVQTLSSGNPRFSRGNQNL